METRQINVHVFVRGKSSMCRSRRHTKGGGVVSLISNPCITLVSGQLHSNAALPQVKESQHLFSRRLVGYHRWPACCMEGKSSTPCWEPDHESSFLQAEA